jgi:hypothetical protein
MSKLIPAAFSALILGSAGASAAVFDLSSPTSSIGTSISVTSGGITLTVTPGSGDAIHQNGNGLGYIDASGDDRFGLDGRQGNIETLSFSFDQDVVLDAMSFTSFRRNRDTATFTNLGGLTSFENPVGGGNTTPTLSGINVSLAAGTVFTVSAEDGNDIFRIMSLEATAVPVPAAAWLFGSALAGIIGLRRRKQ